jgi:DNA-binding transcriptional LysR family regulator
MHGLQPDPLPSRDLAAFVAAVEARTVQGAADALGVTQSAASKRIQALERRIGVRLLERGSHGVWPTDAGRQLYPEAKHALAALARAAAIVGHANDAHRHVLALAASHTIGEFLLPGWLAEFRAADGDTTLRAEIDIVNSPGVLTRVHDGAAEVGFVEGVDALDDYETLMLRHDELRVIVAAGHRWSRRGAVALEELAHEPYYTRERDSGTRAIVTAELELHGIRLAPALETASISALKRTVMGGGFTVLSPVTVEDEVLSGHLRTLPLRGVTIGRDLRAVRRGRPMPGTAAQRLWNWLRDRAPS